MAQLMYQVVALRGTDAPASDTTLEYLRRCGLGRLADALARHNARLGAKAR